MFLQCHQSQTDAPHKSPAIHKMLISIDPLCINCNCMIFLKSSFPRIILSEEVVFFFSLSIYSALGRISSLFFFRTKWNNPLFLVPRTSLTPETFTFSEPTSTMTSQSSGIEEMVYKCSVRACIFL